MPAVQAAPYAAMVMDMRDGRVLHSRGADRRQHPASLTKMMTLYLTFEAVESGRIGLDQRVRVSQHAARQPASKLYLKAGQTVSIRHLIRATATKSANDAAMVLAEAIGGSQAGFGEMMTRKARELGMPNTTFRNPHGLTQSGHLSTARDMAKLARHLFFDFPEYYGVFGQITTYAAGKQVWSTNRRLLRSYRGAEGMKTGYTRAAGYNLVGIASRGSERIIAVVMGESSVASRTRRVAQLLDMGFSRAETHVAVVPPSRGSAAGTVVAVRSAPVPPARPTRQTTGIAAVVEALGPAPAAAAIQAEETVRVASASATLPSPVTETPQATAKAPSSAYAPRRTEPPRLRPVRVATASADVRGTISVAEGSGDGGVPMPPPRPAWSVRLGAFEDRAAALESVTSVTLGDLRPLASAESQIKEFRGQGGAPRYEVRFTGLSSREAGKACRTLKSHGRECVALAPN
ncbi:MAG TPA: serine hydrolase [Thermohalobaculum sp.]|nr:serine hydrolase [Thermohalobaculum sp.]